MAGVIVRDGGMVRSWRGVDGTNTGSEDGGRGNIEGARVDAGSVGVAINVARSR